MHQPRWGWLPDGNEAWIQGRQRRQGRPGDRGSLPHRFSYTPPGAGVAHKYHLLVVGQDQVARVDATTATLKVVVTATDGKVVHSMEIPRAAK